MADLISVPWTRVTRAMCEAGNPLRGKHLYFPASEFDPVNKMAFYPPAPQAETVVFDRNNQSNVHFSFSFGCAKTYPKLRAVYMFSHPGGTQRSFLRRKLTIFVPPCFKAEWSPSATIQLLSSKECQEVIGVIEGRLTWQNRLKAVHLELLSKLG